MSSTNKRAAGSEPDDISEPTTSRPIAETDDKPDPGPHDSTIDQHNSKVIPANEVEERRPKRARRRRHKAYPEEIKREVSPVLDADANLSSDSNVMKNVSVQENATAAEKATSDEVAIASNETSTTKRLVQCNICKRCMTESRLANHIRLLHMYTGQQAKNDENSTVKSKNFRCDSCGRGYVGKYTFDQHVRTHTEGRPKCTDCGSTFSSPFSLYRHRAKVHNAEHNYTVHSCDQCNKEFFSVSELTLHKRRHLDEKDHECPECKKKFAAKGNLRMHMRTHAKDKLYKCDLCDRMFSHPYSLVTHRRIHTNDLPFTCDECGKRYRSKHQLSSHANVHKEESPYSCDKCTKMFRSRTAFKMHQDEHKGIKRFDCQHCGRKFQCQANKSKHERRHLGIKRFKCEKCDKAFIEKQELRNHLKVHDKLESAAAAKAAASDAIEK